MLNLKEISGRIADPALCAAQESEDLKKLCETYPYSQIFPILYLNVLSKSNDVRFDEELQRYAYRISDRTMLYNLLHQNSSEKEVISAAEVEEPNVEAAQISNESSTAQTHEEIVEKTSEAIVESSESASASVLEEEIQEELTPKIEVELESSLQGEAKEATHEAEIETPNFELEIEEGEVVPIEIIQKTEIIEPAFLEKEELSEIEEVDPEVHFELDLTDSIDKESSINHELTFKNEDEQIIVSGFESIPIDEVFQKLGDEQQERDQRFANELTAQTIASAYSIEAEEKRRAQIEIEKQENIEKIDDEIIPSPQEESKTFLEPKLDGKKSFSSWLHANENYSEPNEEKVSVDDLISKFIEESPKISPANEKLFEGRTENNEFYSPIKKAKESLDEQNLPVSETLAKVFAAQGNFPKAIYAYEQLMLIIPEKKIFFAVQIKELQKKLNK